MLITNVLFFIFTYFLSGFVIAAFLKVILGKQKTTLSSAEIVIFGLGFGPIIISLILYFLFLLFPGRTGLFYILVTGLIFVALMVVAWKNLVEYRKKGVNFLGAIVKIAWYIEKDILLISLLVVLIVFYIFIQATASPIVSDDGCFYGCIGRYLYEHKNVNDYPLVSADEKTGAYLRLEHPPGLPLIYTWFYFLQGNTRSDILSRTVSPMYALYLIILLWIVLRKRLNKYAGLFGVLFLVLTPIFVWQAYENSIDLIRMFFIFSSFVLLAGLLESGSISLALLAGAMAGFAMFAHVTGILALIVIMVVYLLLSKESIKKRTVFTIFICFMAIIIGGIQYGINYLKFNNILGPDTFALFYLKVNNFYFPIQLARSGQEGFIRPFGITNIPKTLIFGRLQVFFRPELFGFSYYIFLFALFYWFRYMPKKKIDTTLLLAALLYAIPVIYKFYSNRRYIFTIHPLIIYFGGLALGEVYIWIKSRKLEKRFWLIISAIIIIPIIVLFIPGSMANIKLSGADQGSKIKYLISSKEKQNRILCPGLFEAIEYINTHTPSDSVILTFSQTRYFYYAQRKGIYWSEPRMNAFYSLHNKMVAYQYLMNLDIDYIMIDILYKEDPQFKSSELKDIIEDNKLSKLVFGDDTKLYQLIK